MTTRENTLRSMKGSELIKEADKFGVKVKCDKSRAKLTEAKATVIERILTFEAKQNKFNSPTKNITRTSSRGDLIKYNGKSQNICKWAKELGISANTLYGRLYKLGWTVDKAFTTKGRK